MVCIKPGLRGGCNLPVTSAELSRGWGAFLNVQPFLFVCQHFPAGKERNENFVLSVGTNNPTDFSRTKFDSLHFFYLHDWWVCDGVRPWLTVNASTADKISEILAWLPVFLFFKRRNKVRWALLRLTQICQRAFPGGRYFWDLLFTFLYFLKTISRPSAWCHLSSDCVLALQTKTGFIGVLRKVPVEQNSAFPFSPLPFSTWPEQAWREPSAWCWLSLTSNRSTMVFCQRPLPACKPVILGESFNLICFVVCKEAFRGRKKKNSSLLTVRF